jgi:hypothetical protein
VQKFGANKGMKQSKKASIHDMKIYMCSDANLGTDAGFIILRRCSESSSSNMETSLYSHGNTRGLSTALHIFYTLLYTSILTTTPSSPPTNHSKIL